MVVCVAIAKLLGVVWIIPVTRLIGNPGLGIYANAYAVYNILLTLSTNGFPLALGKLISERNALNKRIEVEQMYRVTIKAIVVFSIISFLIMWFGAPLFSIFVALRDPKLAIEQMTPSIRAISFSLLVVPLMSALRGYLYGFQRLEAPAYSQAIEQLFRVITMVIGAYYVVRVLGHSYIAGAAAATFGAFVGGAIGLILLISAVIPIRREFRNTAISKSPYTNRQMLKVLWKVALPVSLGAMVVPISNMTDTYTVQNILMLAGKTYKTALGDFGIYSRQALFLVQLPLAFAMAIGASVLPAISEAKALKNHNAIQLNTVGTIRTMFFITFPTAAVLLILARPIDFIIAKDYEGSAIIQAVSFMSIFSSLELVSTYILQGLGQMYKPVRNMFLGVIVKVLFNIILILLTKSVMGAAIATTIGYLFSSMLNVLAVRKYGHVQFSLVRLARPFFIATIPLLIGLVFINWLTHAAFTSILSGNSPDTMLWLINVFQFTITTMLGAVIYLFFTMKIGAIREDELRNLPGVGRRLEGIARKLHRSRQVRGQN
jgi:O-antigen/teichoic acid export membrane protein